MHYYALDKSIMRMGNYSQILPKHSIPYISSKFPSKYIKIYLTVLMEVNIDVENCMGRKRHEYIYQILKDVERGGLAELKSLAQNRATLESSIKLIKRLITAKNLGIQQ